MQVNHCLGTAYAREVSRTLSWEAEINKLNSPQIWSLGGFGYALHSTVREKCSYSCLGLVTYNKENSFQSGLFFIVTRTHV